RSCLAAISRITRRFSAMLDRSARTTCTRPGAPACSASATSRRPFSRLLPRTTTSSPNRARASATARPIPSVPPLTTTTLGFPVLGRGWFSDMVLLGRGGHAGSDARCALHRQQQPTRPEEGSLMSATNTGVPSVVRARLPSPVPAHEHESCAVTDVLRRVGDKWSVLVMVLLGRRAHRFNELHRGIEAISQRMLTRTLRTLEEDGLVR